MVEAVMYDFRLSEWFERGWTLQELLAPHCVVFVNQDWEVIGHKSPTGHQCPMSINLLSQAITEVTGIPLEVLSGFESRRDTVADSVKWAWAANRRTTKAEDVAYCLMGIFGVHMPLIYGEGEFNARKRLHQEIKKKAEEPKDVDFLLPIDPVQLGASSGVDRSLDVDRPSQSLPADPPWDIDQAANSSGADSNKTTSVEPIDVDMNDVDATNALTQRIEARRDAPFEHLCSKCQQVLFQPTSSTCNHTFCASCMLEPGNVDLVMVFQPLQLGGKGLGQALIENFGKTYSCPVCRTQAGFWRDDICDTQLQFTRPQEHAHRAELGTAADAAAGIITITIGNWHELVQTLHHRWSFFVKPDRTDIIKEVHMHLHESFAHPHQVIKTPPYMIHCKGWGYFTIVVYVILRAGFTWASKNAEHGPDGAPGSSLKLEWTVDFESYKGRGSQGKCRVKVRRAGI